MKTLKDLNPDKHLIQKFKEMIKDAYGNNHPNNVNWAFKQSIDIDELRDTAREWIKHLEEQKELHGEFVGNGVGENPSFDEPKGFCYAESHLLPYGYDEIINWIKCFFNLEDEDE